MESQHYLALIWFPTFLGFPVDPASVRRGVQATREGSIEDGRGLRVNRAASWALGFNIGALIMTYTILGGSLFKGCARCGQREFVHRAIVPPILAPQKPASLG